MTDKQREQREREKLIQEVAGLCSAGNLIREGQMQYAHAIGNTEVNRKKYGSFFIDSTYNGCLVCSLSLQRFG